jgi:hypothetical protein
MLEDAKGYTPLHLAAFYVSPHQLTWSLGESCGQFCRTRHSLRWSLRRPFQWQLISIAVAMGTLHCW